MVNQLLVGTAKADITPATSVPMAGYVARTSWSLGVHDPLWAKCFIFRSCQEYGALVVLDLLSVHEHWADKIKHEVGKTAAIPPERVVVACTHTHSGPSGFEKPLPNGRCESVVLESIKKMLTGIQSAAEQAMCTITPVLVGVGTITVDGVASHRNRPGRSVDQTLWTLVIRNVDGTIKGILATFPTHSTVLGPENRFLSKDLLGTAAEFVEQRLGEDVVVGLTCGAAGDVSTRFVRKRQDFNELERLGRLLADAIIEQVQKIKVIAAADFSIRLHRCWLPYKSLPSVEQVQRLLDEKREKLETLLQHTEVNTGELRVARTQLEGARLLLNLAKKRGVLASGGVEVSLVGIRVGNGILIGIPGEPFNILNRIIHNNTPTGFFATVMGLTNGYLGYFPDQEAVEEGWYEALASPFDHMATAVLIEEVQKLLRNLVPSECT